MEDQDKKFAKGFNAGYLLSKHEPELLNDLLKSSNMDKEYFQAMELGKKQHDREKLLDQIRQHKKSKDRDRER